MDTLRWPAAWHEMFGGNWPTNDQPASALVATTDAEEWPHVSFLSAGEILITSESRLMLTVWGASTTAANLRRAGRAALYATAENMIVEARLAIHSTEAETAKREIFAGTLQALRPHRAPYADVLGLIAFRLHDSGATFDRWHEQIAAMRAAGAAADTAFRAASP